MQSLQDTRILIIDDDYHICRLLETAVRNEGAQPIIAMNGSEGIAAFQKHAPDLVLLDILMPELDGWSVCRQIRAGSDVPIIMLTALHGEDDVVRGLDFGAIDYVTKPFKIRVLLARMRAALRQANLTNNIRLTRKYKDDYLSIDLDRRRVTIRGKPVSLSATEYSLLSLLLQNMGRVLSFEDILTSVWGTEYLENADYVRVYIWHLRKKLERNPKVPSYIHTEYGVGYRFEPLRRLVQ